MRRIVLTASLLAFGLTLSACGGGMDPSEWFNTKKPLPGDRKAVFPEGVPGVPQGVPPDLVQGYQPPPEPVPEPRVVEAKPKAKPKPKPKQPAAPQQAPAQSQSAFPDPPQR